MLDRPQHACQTCKPPKTSAWSLAENGWLICEPCYRRIEETLAEIGERFLLLDPSPGGGQSDGRGSPGFGSKPPCNLSVVVVRDSRSSTTARVWVGKDGRVHREDESPGMSVWACLSTWTTDVCELRGFQTRYQAVGDMCSWIGSQLDWLARQESIVEFERDVTRLVRQLRPLTGERRYLVGYCPNEMLNEAGDGIIACGRKLYVPDSGDSLSCDWCGKEWSRPTWEALARSLHEFVA